MKLKFTSAAWLDYGWWQAKDRRIVKRINELVKDIERNGHQGIGKPEPLQHNYRGWWSRRINEEHRLVYKIVEDEIWILSCRFHYEK